MTRFDCKCGIIGCVHCAANSFIDKAVAEERRTIRRDMKAELNSRILYGIMTVLNPDGAVPAMEIRLQAMDTGEWEDIGKINVDEWVKRRDRYLRSVGRVPDEPESKLTGL